MIWRRWTGRLPTGIDRVCLAYLRHYAGRSRAVIQRAGHQFALNDRDSAKLFALLVEGGGGGFRRRLSLLLGPALLRSLRASDIDRNLYLNIGHTGLEQAGLGSWIAAHRLRAVYLIHDLIPLTHPEYCRAGEGDRHRQRMSLVLDTAAGIIGNSRYTIESLTRFAEGSGRLMPRAIPAPLGIDLPSCASLKPLAAEDDPYFVMIGTIEARKNHLLMLQLWSRLVERFGAKAPQMRIIGQRGWEADQAFEMLDRAWEFQGRVVEIGRCSDADLVSQLRGARALLFPSLAEGYGLPLVEALAVGTPVIASDLPVFREIAGDLPDYVDPLDGPSWLDRILSYSQAESADRVAQVRRLAGYAAPTWEAHFSVVDSWLDEL